MGRTAGSGDTRRTKQIRNDSSRDQRAVKTNLAACQSQPPVSWPMRCRIRATWKRKRSITARPQTVRAAESESRRAGTGVLDEPGTGPRRCARAEPTDLGGEGRSNRFCRRPRRRRSRSPGVSRKGAALRGPAGRPVRGADRTVVTRASGTRRPAARGDRSQPIDGTTPSSAPGRLVDLARRPAPRPASGSG